MFWLILISGAISSAILRVDPVFGTMAGCFVGGFCGIIYILLKPVLRRLQLFNSKKRKRIVTIILCSIPICLNVAIYKPTSKSMFKRFIIKPIPQSVSGIHGYMHWGGPDYSADISFSASESDLQTIVQNKKLEKIEKFKIDQNGIQTFDQGTNLGARDFCSDPEKWQSAELFYAADRQKSVYYWLFYKRETGEAFFYTMSI
ncbi:MAG: hypothetical protein ABFD79_11185 [Phycisphaerales bacterium]